MFCFDPSCKEQEIFKKQVYSKIKIATTFKKITKLKLRGNLDFDIDLQIFNVFKSKVFKSKRLKSCYLVKKQKFLNVNALDVNVIIIWILNSERTKVFGCKRTSCKRYYNLRF